MTGAYRIAVILASALFLPALCQAQTTKPTTSPTTSPATTQAAASNEEDFDTLAKRLGSTDWKERQLAEQGIVNMGKAVVPRVEELGKKSPDPEVQQRAKAIVRQIAIASLTSPSLVTLKFNKAPAGEVYDALFEQAGMKMEMMPPNLLDAARARGGVGAAAAATVTIDAQKVPFWKAVTMLEKQTGVFPESFGDQMRLTDRRMGGFGKQRDVCISGPFMVVSDNTFPTMMTELSVFVEPRLRVLGHAAEPTIDEATDANGNPMTPDNRAAAALPPAMAARMARAAGAGRIDQFGGNGFRLHLRRPIPRGGFVRGSARVYLVTENQTVEIDNVAKANNVERIVDGRRFLLNAMNVDPGQWMITLVVYQADGPAQNMMNLPLELLDEKGNALTVRGRGANGGEKRVVFNNEYVQGPNVGPPAKLRMVVPKKSREIDIPFEFGAKPVPVPAGAPAAAGDGNEKAAAE